MDDHDPSVVALVGSPHRRGNTAFAVEVAVAELERRGVRCQTVMLCDLAGSLIGDGQGGHIEALLDDVWRADGLILATPVCFCNVSAQMKAFMDRTNERYETGRWLVPRVVGLLAIGAHGGFTETVAAMRRYLDLMAPSHPPIEVATGHADAQGEARRSQEIRRAAIAMAARLADLLRGAGPGGSSQA